MTTEGPVLPALLFMMSGGAVGARSRGGGFGLPCKSDQGLDLDRVGKAYADAIVVRPPRFGVKPHTGRIFERQRRARRHIPQSFDQGPARGDVANDCLVTISAAQHVDRAQDVAARRTRALIALRDDLPVALA